MSCILELEHFWWTNVVCFWGWSPCCVVQRNGMKWYLGHLFKMFSTQKRPSTPAFPALWGRVARWPLQAASRLAQPQIAFKSKWQSCRKQWLFDLVCCFVCFVFGQKHGFSWLLVLRVYVEVFTVFRSLTRKGMCLVVEAMPSIPSTVLPHKILPSVTLRRALSLELRWRMVDMW